MIARTAFFAAGAFFALALRFFGGIWQWFLKVLKVFKPSAPQLLADVSPLIRTANSA